MRTALTTASEDQLLARYTTVLLESGSPSCESSETASHRLDGPDSDLLKRLAHLLRGVSSLEVQDLRVVFRDPIRGEVVLSENEFSLCNSACSTPEEKPVIGKCFISWPTACQLLPRC